MERCVDARLLLLSLYITRRFGAMIFNPICFLFVFMIRRFVVNVNARALSPMNMRLYMPFMPCSRAYFLRYAVHDVLVCKGFLIEGHLRRIIFFLCLAFVSVLSFHFFEKKKFYMKNNNRKCKEFDCVRFSKMKKKTEYLL